MSTDASLDLCQPAGASERGDSGAVMGTSCSAVHTCYSFARESEERQWKSERIDVRSTKVRPVGQSSNVNSKEMSMSIKAKKKSK